MAKRTDIKRVMIIGSGPIVIGQAAEFDYAGVQACRALKEENLEVVLVNSNPATIMTDENIADKVYIEPLTVESLTPVRLTATLSYKPFNVMLSIDNTIKPHSSSTPPIVNSLPSFSMLL